MDNYIKALTYQEQVRYYRAKYQKAWENYEMILNRLENMADCFHIDLLKGFIKREIKTKEHDVELYQPLFYDNIPFERGFK